MFVNVDDAHLEQTQEFLEEYTRNVDTSLPVVSRQVMMEQYQAETRSSAVMGNAVSITIALVGILNFINSMVTSIVSRKKEFAVIQSVGMTKRQLCRMLVEEGLYYAAITLAASLLAGSLAVGIGVRAMVEGGYTTFRFTLFPLAVCAPALILFAAAVPYVMLPESGETKRGGAAADGVIQSEWSPFSISAIVPCTRRPRNFCSSRDRSFG